MEKIKWMQQRLGKFTASQIHSLLVGARGRADDFGKAAMSYIREKAAEILTGTGEDVTNRAMEWGTFHEPAAVAAYMERYGKAKYYGSENPVFIEHGEYSGGSPDAVSDTHLIEVKCPYRSVNHVENMLLTADTFRAEHPDYYAQIQFNMLLTGKSKAHFVSFDPRMACREQQLCVIEIPADAEFIAAIIERIEKAETELKKIISKIINNE
ncbi:MAG: YqaJ viral recombinase family protein [Prevotellaceae bacterium]|jgi:hypothetical protein|nr:YqaJ viral recombinase family protein [Prevotellaceae bacterium]